MLTASNQLGSYMRKSPARPPWIPTRFERLEQALSANFESLQELTVAAADFST